MSVNSKHQSQYTDRWSIDHAREFYSISVWSEGYFDVNSSGHVVAKPDHNTCIDLDEVSKNIRQHGLSFPVLVRFPQILQARIREIDDAFIQAASLYSGQLKHITCYPIKVNQQRTVIEQILASECEQIGLEVGTKTELLVALGLLERSGSKLICNGYKDRAYIRLALYAQTMGLDVFIIIENLSELSVIKQESERLGISPKLGLRLKLNSIAEGNWQNSGGKSAKFGLDVEDVLYCLAKLSEWSCQSWLQLIHFHMGSQITKLDDFAVGLQEAMAVFGEITKRGFELEYIDVGGGLAIDYASKHDESYFSRAYTISEYAEVIVNTVVNYCHKNSFRLPIVFTENGRAITAHHAMLITNVIKDRDHEKNDIVARPETGIQEIYDKGDDLLELIEKNAEDLRHEKNIFESMLQEKFLQGEVTLEQRAWAENILYRCAAFKHRPDKQLQYRTSATQDKYYCNFSVFQSMPDVWGLDQIFPVVPLTKLNTKPSKDVRLHDLTCDSDGKVTHYAFNNGIQDYITLHELSFDQEYLIGFFLLGAYQEVLGDMHNLFGDTHALNVELDSNGQIQFTELELGDCTNEILASIHLGGDQIIQLCQKRLEAAHTTNVTTEEILEEINNALYGYTYLDSVDRPAHRIKR